LLFLACRSEQALKGGAETAAPLEDSGLEGSGEGEGEGDGSGTDGASDSGGGGSGGATDSGGGGSGGATDSGDGGGEPFLIELVSDASWKAVGGESEEGPADWTSPAFDDSAWPMAVAPAPSACGAEWTVNEEWELPALSFWDETDAYAAFFRKVVHVPDPSAVDLAKITVIADDDVAVWVNGLQLYLEVDWGMSEDTGFDNQAYLGVVDLKEALVAGDNLIAVEGLDSAGGCRWAFVSGQISGDGAP
jgi:hypothetical protein